MRVSVATELRILRSCDGTYFAPFGMGTEFWQRYQEVFEQVRVIARCDAAVGTVPEGWSPLAGEGLEIAELDPYRSPTEYLVKRRSRYRLLRGLLVAGPCIVRCPGIVARDAINARASTGEPVALEVVGDPDTALAPGAAEVPARRFARRALSRNLRSACANADAVAYVTARTLQRKYPPRPGAVTSAYSSISLPDRWFERRLRGVETAPAGHLLTVASLEQPYKGIDVLLRALSIVRRSVPSIRLDVIGGGRLLPLYQRMAGELRLDDVVSFHGLKPRDEVRQFLLNADIFVLASRSEGLPRAMIEALAVGVPCIGTNAGGIPELLPADAMCAPGAVDDLARLVTRCVRDDAWRGELVDGGRLVAEQYRAENVRRCRIEFLHRVRELNE